MTTEDRTTQHNITHNTIPLSHHTTTHHTIPTPAEIFPPSTVPAMKAIVLLPCEGVLRACGLVEVVVVEA
jgi:hypothetical protein